MKATTKLSTAIALALISTGISTGTQAAGFALIENSASGMGNAFAGGAAIAEDASTVFFNPAGMTRLSGSQIVIAGHIVAPKADFENNGSTLSNDAAPFPGAGTAIIGTNDDGGETGYVANFYYTTQIGNDSVFGLGINAPFGLATEYDDDWVGRYTAIKSEVLTVNINPSFATKTTDKLSVGFGLNIQYVDATLSNKLDSASLCLGPLSAGGAACIGAGLTSIGDQTVDSSQELSGDDWSIGWNLGFLYDIDTDSRLGVAYRSSIKHRLEGSVNFQLDPALAIGIPSSTTVFAAAPINAGLELPQSLSVSYYRDIDPKLAVMADITWTKWRNFEELAINFEGSPLGASVIPEDWDDSYRFAVGVSYKQDEKMTYRAGLAYDQTPIKSAELRTPRIPGNDRKWLSLGLGYNMSADMSIDVGYSHLFVSDTDINNTDASFGHTVTGTYDASVDILSVQATFKFD